MADWRQCADWLIRCQMLPTEHHLMSSKNVQNLANLLKDGVLICSLLNKLKPDTLDGKDFSQRPQMSQFLCQKNINIFLQKCSSVFHMKNEDLFETADLARLNNFGKVLHTLSVLSQTPLAQKSRISSFVLSEKPGTFIKLATDSEMYEPCMEEEILYQDCMLSDFATYEDLCSLRQHARNIIQETPTKSKRDFCIEEIVETEKNYIEALKMINTKFMKPLANCKDLLSPTDFDKIFMGNEKLLEIHQNFLEILMKASKKAGHTILTIPDCFIMFKERFLYYGEFSSNLTSSQELLGKLCQNNATFLQKILECQLAANDGKFKLHDLLAIPMQRVLKYHLLINELMKHTDVNHPERKSLESALEAMQDLSLFVNEVRRDHEIINAIKLLQNSVADFPSDIELEKCGRILRDGEMKVKLHGENTTHLRHLFLFDKILLVFKHTKGDTYSYKMKLLLEEYALDDIRDKTAIQLTSQNGRVFTIYAKNPDIRNRWRDGIRMAKDNITPPHAVNSKHSFVMATFDRPTICDVCRKFLRGSFFQGYRCEKTSMAAHKECLEKAKDKDGPPTAIPQRSREKVVAISPYEGIPSPPKAGMTFLKFNVNDIIDVCGSSEMRWIEGELNGRRGFFPQSHVKTVVTHKNSLEPGQSVRSCITLTTSDVDIESSTWYAGGMTRDEANTVLEGLPNGTFLVRKSPNQKTEHSISLQFNGVKHIKIVKTDTDKDTHYQLNLANKFLSITGLVEHHRQNSLEKIFPDACTTLVLPFKDAIVMRKGASQTDNEIENLKGNVGYCVAMYNFSATTPNRISIKRGDRIAILSKSSEVSGWWKGLLNGKTGFFPASYVKE